MEEISQVGQPEFTPTLKFGVRGGGGWLMYDQGVWRVWRWRPSPAPDLRGLRNYFHQLSGACMVGVRSCGGTRVAACGAVVPGGARGVPTPSFVQRSARLRSVHTELTRYEALPKLFFF